MQSIYRICRFDIDFICILALGTGRSVLRGTLDVARRLRMECGVDELDTAFGALPRAVDEAPEPAQDTQAQYTPGEFLKQAGLVIGVCLGMAVLAQLLVILVGE